MGTLTIDNQTVSYETIAESAADRSYVIEIEYSRRFADETERTAIDLPAVGRDEVTRDAVEEHLADWYAGQGGITIEGYEVIERVECRRGELQTVERDRPTSGPADKPDPGVAADDLAEGELIAYYVGGPDHEIYGHISEGLVVALPPWSRDPPESNPTVTDAVLVDTGDRHKEIPLAWIVGSVADSEIGEAVDRPRPELRDEAAASSATD